MHTNHSVVFVKRWLNIYFFYLKFSLIVLSLFGLDFVMLLLSFYTRAIKMILFVFYENICEGFLKSELFTSQTDLLYTYNIFCHKNWELVKSCFAL